MANRVRAPVVVVAHDPRWAERFQVERRGLGQAFAGVCAHIEHVGSTAVPGLGAKPIVDIMVGVTDLKQVERRLPALARLEYAYVPEYEAQLPARRYFRKPSAGPRKVHLHCVVTGSAFWIDHLLFRDHLREQPSVARAYQELKRRLADELRRDRIAYTEAKGEFIQATLLRARSEAR